MSIFEARVARRIILLFIVSALVPVLAMAGVSFAAVNTQLEQHSRERLDELTRNAGQSIVQQIRLAETALRAVRARLLEGGIGPADVAVLTPTVRSLGWTDSGGGMHALRGDSLTPSPFDDGERARLTNDELVLRVEDASPEARISLVLALEPGALASGSLWAELVNDSLWSASETFATLSTVRDFCVFGRGTYLHCAVGSRLLLSALDSASSVSQSGTIQSRLEDGREYIAGYWSFYPSGSYDRAPWIVVVSEDAETVRAPLEGFSSLFALGLLLAILLVVLLSNVQIRRTLQPLTALEAGTAEVAKGNLAARVSVTGNDEFGHLAESFNAMASTLEQQFSQFRAIQAVGDAALSGSDRDGVVATALAHLPPIHTGHAAAVLSVVEDKSEAEILWTTGEGMLGRTRLTLTAQDDAWLRAHATGGVITNGAPPFASVARGKLGNNSIAAYPHIVKGHVRGATLVSLPSGGMITPEGSGRLRQVADQVAVALEDVRLIGELEELSWGTIVAFARAIDAKSSWTAGHSERVCEMAMGLARELGFGVDDLETLHRGGLLHDIGKIGVPNAILDKQGRLTPEEIAIIQRHPSIGVNILAPIAAFERALPIVGQHHERWDGKGYPEGLAAEEIDPLARVLAVADAFDALASARPYRPGRSAAEVSAVIHADSGTQFEPRVVEAMDRYLAGLVIETKGAGNVVA